MTLPAAFHVAIILDRSGSMASIRNKAIGAVNGYLASLKADEGTSGALITLTIFDSESIDVIRDGAPIASCAALTAAEYEPRGLTPLYDAIGATAAALEKRAADRRVLVIVTDGHENASQQFTRASILALISQRQADGWLVVYLGAHADTWHEAAAIGIAHGATAMVDLSEAHVVASGLHALSARYLQQGVAAFTDEERVVFAPNAIPPQRSTSRTNKSDRAIEGAGRNLSPQGLEKGIPGGLPIRVKSDQLAEAHAVAAKIIDYAL